MADIIRLLPDALANQIAAGEVVQRPASAVKELLENAIDAGAARITLVVREGGKSFIQVTDDGSGMSETDARMSFERHATSKIVSTEDLFRIRSMGFRGEALASIAAVAQVELKTRRADAELGTRIVIEGSKVQLQEPCQTPEGTQLTIRNLFYNVPARKTFLKSDARELGHVEEAFVQVAMAHPSVAFSMFSGDREIFKLASGNLRQRIVGLMGNDMNKQLVPLEEETDMIRLRGFIGIPEAARKRRGDQFLFVNQRFIRSAYLNHALFSAYESLLQEGYFPFYAVFLEIDPGRIDVNVHPTKQEIKFEDEKIVYNYLKVAARHALGKYHVMPTLDFEQDPVFRSNPEEFARPASGGGSSSPLFTPPPRGDRNPAQGDWRQLYEQVAGTPLSGRQEPPPPGIVRVESGLAASEEEEGLFEGAGDTLQGPEPYQLHGAYILCPIRSGLMILHQQSAHERILYERYLDQQEQDSPGVQQLLFPKVIELSASDAALLEEMLPGIRRMGFEIEPFGTQSYILHGLPANLSDHLQDESLIQALIGRYRDNLYQEMDVHEKVAWAVARSTAMKTAKKLDKEEMKTLVDQLFACKVPYSSPSGRKCFITLDMSDLDKRFNL